MTFFISKEYLTDHNPGTFHKIRNTLFNLLQQSNQDATTYNNIPAERVFEIGKFIEIND